MMKICLDIDGVCADWHQGVLALFPDKARGVTLDPWPTPGNDELSDALGISEDQMWRAIDAAGSDWWKNLRPYEWHYTLWDLLHQNEANEVIYLTAPSWHPSSHSGKHEWMRFWHGETFRDYSISPRKHFCANGQTILIDDREKNVDAFEKHGGLSILFPQPWNRNYHIASKGPEKIAYVRSWLVEYGALDG